MTFVGWAQIALMLAAVIAAAIPLSAYIARVLAGERTFLSPILAPVERVFYKLSGVDPAREQGWLVYAMAMLAFSIAGFVSLYALQRLQNIFRSIRKGSAGSLRSRLQHVGQFHHQHQLAELQRRDDDEPSRPDARVDRSQFPVGRDGSRHGVCAGSRFRARGIADGRQFLGRSDARHALRAAAALHRCRACPRRARRSADARRLRRSDDA